MMTTLRWLLPRQHERSITSRFACANAVVSDDSNDDGAIGISPTTTAP
jgi:hypothetical protein